MGAGVVSDIIWKLPGFDWTFGFFIIVLVYLVTFYGARYLWYRHLEPTKLSKVYSTGLGSYIMLSIFTWILLSTLFH